jgi:hypothetical protein
MSTKTQASGPPKKPLVLNLKERLDKKKGKGKGNKTPPKKAPLLNEQEAPKQVTHKDHKGPDVPAKGKEPGGAPKVAPLVDEQKPPKQLSNKKSPALPKPKKVGVIARIRAAAKKLEDAVPF